MKIEEISMTPADAARLLEHNTVNRKLSRSRVRGLIASIERGEWQLDGNPVKLAKDDTIIDGQHRLTAIAEAQVESVPVILISDLPAETRLVVDAGKTRTFADYLHINDVPNDLSMAAAVRGVWTYQNGLHDWHADWFTRPSPTNLQLWELYKKRQADFEKAVSQANKVLRTVRASRAIISTGWIVLSDVECASCGPASEDVAEFYEQLAMRTDTVSDGAMAFARLMNVRGGGGAAGAHYRASYTATEQLALLIKGWNAYREGRTLQMLSWRSGGKNPEKFPTPH